MANNLDSEFEVQTAILEKMGGDPEQNFDSPYEVQLAILDAIEGGGGGAVIDDENISPNTVWSSEKVYDELGGVIIQDGQIMTQELYDFLHHMPFPHNEHKIWLKKGNLCFAVNEHQGDAVMVAFAHDSIGVCQYFVDINALTVGQTITIGRTDILPDNTLQNIDTILQTIIGA